jgi:Holliday junction DNA helicase RuvB
VEKALSLEGIDKYGLTKSDKRYLSAIYGVYGCGPVGLQAIAATIGEDTSTVENYIEGYLIRLGFIARTKTGRLLTSQGMEYIVGSNAL